MTTVTPYELLRTKYKLPVESVIQSIQKLKQDPITDPKIAEERVFELIGAGLPALVDPTHTIYAYYYLVQNIIEAKLNGEVLNKQDVLVKSIDSAQKYISDNSWVFAQPETPVSEPKLDANGNVTKKGDKKIQAIALWNKHKDEKLSRKRWIEMLVEIGLTAGGASTYYQNLKTGKYTQES